MARWHRGAHGGTYGGNPIGCAAALATIDVILDEQLVDNARRARGRQLIDGLRELQSRHAGIGDVRGLGLMVARRAHRPRRHARRGSHRGDHDALPRARAT